jgi:DNA mismatch endonuclease (patch repair protein)
MGPVLATRPRFEGRTVLGRLQREPGLDHLSDKERSALMGRIRSSGGRVEHEIRRAVHKLGFRFRLHRRELPGTPDLVFPRLRKVIFVHGCFWHRHKCPKGRQLPATNKAFWEAKLDANSRRDRKCLDALRKLGWKPLVIWECEAKDMERVIHALRAFLSG